MAEVHIKCVVCGESRVLVTIPEGWTKPDPTEIDGRCPAHSDERVRLTISRNKLVETIRAASQIDRDRLDVDEIADAIIRAGEAP